MSSQELAAETKDESVRQIQVLGAKPKDLVRRTRRTRKRAAEDEGEEELLIPQKPIAPIIVSKVVPASKSDNQVAPAPKAPEVQPVAIKPKVVLKPKLKQTPKVLLKKKEEHQPTPAVGEQKAGAIVQKPKTRKVILHSLSKRVNKTRNAVSQAKDLSIEHIRAVLIDKKLIKPTSKAPESILRQIYSDSLIVAKKTL